MTAWLIKHCIKNPENTEDIDVRSAYGTLGSMTGIVVNIALSVTKFLLGIFTGSLAVTADAVNNLSDAAGSIMSLVSVRIAGKPNDKEHPFGHGRMEYIGALIVGFLILIASYQLCKDSISSIMHPKDLSVSVLVVALLFLSILAKLWLYFFYRKLAKAINSVPLRAVAEDSMNDVLATSAVLISIVLHWIFDWEIDGYIGMVVALFVLKTGIDVCKDTVDRLLGEEPSPEFVKELKTRLLSYDGILGVHDLIVNEYGPERTIASVHAEVSAKGDIVAVHEIIDKAEREIEKAMHITLCIHMDPIVTDDPVINGVHQKMCEYLSSLDHRFTMHDFRMVPGHGKTTLIFDCLIPIDFKGSTDMIQKQLLAYAKTLDPKYEVLIQFDSDFT